VAEALGLEIINSEIVVPHVAGSLGVEHSAVQRYLDGKASLFDRWQIDSRKLSQYTLDQILDLALKDNVLIRGWGAAALFQGIHGIICVRVCAPMAHRVRVMMERLDTKNAVAMQHEIERFDAGAFTCDACRIQLRLERCTDVPYCVKLCAGNDGRLRQCGLRPGTASTIPG
jgi:Cytidylate kinase-like family